MTVRSDFCDDFHDNPHDDFHDPTESGPGTLDTVPLLFASQPSRTVPLQFYNPLPLGVGVLYVWLFGSFFQENRTMPFKEEFTSVGRWSKIKCLRQLNHHYQKSLRADIPSPRLSEWLMNGRERPQRVRERSFLLLSVRSWLRKIGSND